MKKNLKKKIIFSSYDDVKNPVYAGGGAIAVREIARRLAKNFEVTVITGFYKGAKNETLDGVRYIRIGSDILGHKAGQLIFQYELLRYALKLKHDLWIESSTLPFTFSLLPLFSKKPVISWINMLCSYDMERKYKINFRWVERKLSKLYKYAVVPTDWVRKEVNGLNKKIKVFKIAPGMGRVDVKKKAGKSKKAGYKNYILFIGRVEVDQKGLDLLVKAAAMANATVRVIIAGSGSRPEEEKLARLISENGAQEKIIRVGRVDGAVKHMLYKNSLAVVVPSRFETFSMTALEALRYNKPVICWNIPQLKWITEKFADKPAPFDIKDLSRYLNKYFTGRSLKKIDESEKKAFLAKFSQEYVEEQFMKTVKEVLS